MCSGRAWQLQKMVEHVQKQLRTHQSAEIWRHNQFDVSTDRGFLGVKIRHATFVERDAYGTSKLVTLLESLLRPKNCSNRRMNRSFIGACLGAVTKALAYHFNISRRVPTSDRRALTTVVGRCCTNGNMMVTRTNIYLA